MKRSVLIVLSSIVVGGAALVVYLALRGDGADSASSRTAKRSTALVVKALPSETTRSSPSEHLFVAGMQIRGRHTIGVSWESGKRVPDGLTVLRENIAYAAKAGFDALVLEAVDSGTGECFFKHDALRRFGWRQGPSLAGHVVAEARRRGLSVFADPSGFFRHRRRNRARIQSTDSPLGAGEAGALAQALLDIGFDGIVAETFAIEDAAEIRAATAVSKKVFVSVGGSAAANADVIVADDSLDTFSTSRASVILARGHGYGRRNWVRIRGDAHVPLGVARNALLLRAVQSGIDGCLFAPRTVQDFRWLAESLQIEDLRDQIRRIRRSHGTRPVANLVLVLPEQAEAREAALAELGRRAAVLINSLTLSGFDVKATFGDPLPDAAIHAVLAVGQIGQVSTDLPDAILSLLESDGEVLLVVLGGRDEGNWRRAMRLFGIKSNQWTTIDDEETVLVAREGRKSLINGNALHLQTSYVLNHMVRASLQSPFVGLGAVGQHSAFFSLSPTLLEIKLPVREKTELRLIRFGPDGRRQSVEIVPYQAPFKAAMKRHELLIVDASRTP